MYFTQDFIRFKLLNINICETNIYEKIYLHINLFIKFYLKI